ncbi:MAG: thioredoxin family protein [bacterium]|nr:thioredoxin family protein [bacterium]
MKQRISLFVVTIIMILPLALYAIFKAPADSAAIAASGKPVVVEFSSPMCSECLKLKKVLDVVEPKYSGKIIFKKINAAQMNRTTMKQVQKYEVKVVPTLVFLDKDGNTLFKTEGAMPQEVLTERLDTILK